MPLLADHPWQRKHAPEDGDLVRRFYLPVLEETARYDPLTGCFRASAVATRDIEGLVHDDRRIRLVVGCTLVPAEIDAIERDEKMRPLVEHHLAPVPLAAPDDHGRGTLELLTRMVARQSLVSATGWPCEWAGLT